MENRKLVIPKTEAYPLQDSKPILIDFFADRCSSCQTMEKVIARLEEQSGTVLEIMKIDVDEQPAVAAAFRVRNIPTFLLMKNGEILWRKSGIVSRRDMEEMLKEKGVDLNTKK